MTDRQNIVRHGVSLLAAVCLFVAINYKNFSRPQYCADCSYLYGVPFTFFREGGFAGTREIVWGGVVADLLVGMVCAAALAWAWKLLFYKRSNYSSNSN
jgi:hypothetical protein